MEKATKERINKLIVLYRRGLIDFVECYKGISNTVETWTETETDTEQRRSLQAKLYRYGFHKLDNAYRRMNGGK
jgi:hypothetical protein